VDTTHFIWSIYGFLALNIVTAIGISFFTKGPSVAHAVVFAAFSVLFCMVLWLVFDLVSPVIFGVMAIAAGILLVNAHAFRKTQQSSGAASKRRDQ